MPLRKLVCAMACALALNAAAQLATPDPDWKETDAPAPPPLDVSRLVDFEVSPQSSLKFGVDPASISIGKDGIVRYVMVARSASGAVNAMYEGIRCNTAEVRTYARHNPGSGWTAVTEPSWKSLYSGTVSPHSLRFARQGGCNGAAPPLNVANVLRDLKNLDYERKK